MSAGNEGFSPAPVSERGVDIPKKSETKSKKKAKEAPKLGLVAVESQPQRDKPKSADKPAAERNWYDAPRPPAETKAATKAEAKTEVAAPLSPEAVTAKLQAAEKSLPAADTHEFGLDTSPTATSELPTDRLTAAEDQVIDQVLTQEVARDRQQTMPEHAPVADPETASPDARGDQAASEFIADVADGKDPDAAFADKLQAVGLENERIAALVEETAVPALDTAAEASETPDSEAEPEAIDEPDAEKPEVEPGEAADPADPAETTAEAPPDDDDEADPPDPVIPAGGGTGGGGPTAPPTGPGPGGPGGPPGGGPVPPFGPGGAPGGPGGPGVPTFVNGAVNFAPPLAAVAANRLRTPNVRGGNAAGAALIGGVIGYMIGRRGGRLRTEARLLPVQKKLEKRVNNLQWQLQEREAIIRRTAREQAPTRFGGFFGGSGLLQHQEQRPAAGPKPVTAESMTKKPELATAPRRPAPEARQLHVPQKAPEHIGHMLMAAEAPALRHVQKLAPEMAAARATMEKQAELAPEAPKPLTAKRIETLNRAELLELSERVSVEGSTLRQIYENNLIGERGLRRLLTEYMHGGDLKKALKNEILEREIDFERDPAMRDHAQQSGGTATGGGTAALNTLIQKAAASVDGGSAAAEAFTDHTAQETIQQERDRQRQLIDLGMGAVIAILAVAVVILFVTRG